MPSIRQVIGAMAVGLVAVAVALPPQPKLSAQARRAYDFGVLARKDMERRQNPTTGLPDGLTDVDILELYVFLPPSQSPSHFQIKQENILIYTTAPSH